MLRSLHSLRARAFILPALLLAAALLAPVLPSPALAAPDEPYVETAPPRGWHLFTRPSCKNPTDQWAYVQTLVRDKSLRSATRQATALRLFWPDSPEAPLAQLLSARLLDQRGKTSDAFDAYQLLLERYPESCDYVAVTADQLRLANTVYTSRLATCWGLFPGFQAPERAIPLYKKILDTSPESPSAPEAAYRIGLANEFNYDYNEAITAFAQVANRFPESPRAADAALGQARCYIAIADDAPNDARAREAAIAACDYLLSAYPEHLRRSTIESARTRLLARRHDAALARCLYYDKTLKNPAAAFLEYQNFVILYPDSPSVPQAQSRIRALHAAHPDLPLLPATESLLAATPDDLNAPVIP